MKLQNLSSEDAYRGALIKSPLLFVSLLSFSIFLIYVFVQIVLKRGALIGAFLDGIQFVLYLSPMLYYFHFRPLYFDIQQRRRAEEELKVSDEHLRDLCAHLLVAQETERKKISIELHDDLGQALTFLKLRLKFIKCRLAGNQGHLQEACKENLIIIDRVINSVRTLSKKMSPSILEDLGLTVALNRLIEDFAKYNYAVEISVEMPEDLDTFFSKGDQILVYRIFQEALTNMSKHSQSRHVSLKVTQPDEASIEFRIEDDGRGFDLERETGSGRVGLGIAALQQRVRTLGGSLSIITQEGKGTKVAFTLPRKGVRDGCIQDHSGRRPQDFPTGPEADHSGTGRP